MPAWFPDWRGQACVIVASGPSAVSADLAALRGRARFIAINASWRLCPWADALYGSDAEWWRTGAGDGFGGLKISRSDHPGVERVQLRPDGRGGWVDELLFDRPGEIGAGGCGGFQALNLAAQFGANPVRLVGFDARIDEGVHWHGRHGPGLNNPTKATAARWARCLDAAAPVLAARGIDVINHSSASALTGFRKAALPEAVTMWVLFSADHDYTPAEDRRATVAYKAGWRGSVRRECGEEAIALGRAEEVEAPTRPADVITGAKATFILTDEIEGTPRDPLDHDGNGRKGGTKARAAKAKG